MKTCEVCKHFYTLEEDRKPGFGRCMALDFRLEDKASLRARATVAVLERVSNVQLHVGKNFGCIHWRSRARDPELPAEPPPDIYIPEFDDPRPDNE